MATIKVIHQFSLSNKKGNTLSHFSNTFKCKNTCKFMNSLNCKIICFLIYFKAIRYNIFLYLLKVTKIQGTSNFRWLIYKFRCKNTFPTNISQTPSCFSPCMFTFTSAEKDKSNNGDINHMTMSYQPGNEAVKPELLWNGSLDMQA